MEDIAREAMREGALGLGASLIYAPAFYAKTPELLALTKAVAESGGRYVAHMRSEANRLLEATDELIGIARDARVHGEVYHLKAAGEANWPKLAQAIESSNPRARPGCPSPPTCTPISPGSTGSRRRDAALGAGGRTRTRG